MSDTKRTVDLVVVGGGPGGYTAAFLAADRGMSVALIDDAPRPGGVCLYRGCMPSKALLHAAKVLTDAREASGWGLSFNDLSIDVDRLRDWKNEIVRKLTAGLFHLSKQRKVSFLQGHAEFLDAQTVRVTSGDVSRDKETIGFTNAIVATGSRPAMPEAFRLDDPRVLDSTDALELEKIPASLLVVGGGYIGLELGTVYAALGTKVTVVELSKSLLPGADADLVRVLARRIDQMVDRVCLETAATELVPQSDGLDAVLEGSDGDVRTQRFDQVLVAVGRVPNSFVPGLEHTLVARDSRDFIVVDPHCRTAEPSIFAIGDVVGEPMLAHKAFAEARVVVDVLCGGSLKFDSRTVPAVVFTDPEVAWCGLGEDEAVAQGRKIVVAKFPWGASGRALTLNRPEGLTKLVIDPESEQILGVGVVGVGAGELISEAVVAVEMGMTVTDLKNTIHPHPTLAETVMEAAEVFFGESSHVYRRRRSQ